MNSHENRYIARFLATSRIALGLHEDSFTHGMKEDAPAHGRPRRAPSNCSPAEMRLTMSQRERVFALLRALAAPHVLNARGSADSRLHLRPRHSRPLPRRRDRGG
jgi:hypothetical protein